MTFLFHKNNKIVYISNLKKKITSNIQIISVSHVYKAAILSINIKQ